MISGAKAKARDASDSISSAKERARETANATVGVAVEVVGNAQAYMNTAGQIPDEILEKRKNREAIIQGLLHGRVVWYNDCIRDYWFYTKQTHVVIGLLACHKLHPYSKCKRFFVWLSSVAAGFGLAMMLLDETGQKQGAQDLQSAAVTTAGILASIVLAIMNVIMVQAMTCSCMQEGSCCFSLLGNVGRLGAEGIGMCVVLYGWGIALCFLGFGLLFRKSPYRLVAEAFGLAQAYAFVIGLLTGLAMFLFANYGCCCIAGQAGAATDRKSAPYPHGARYPTNMEAFQEGDPCNCGSGSTSGGPYGQQ